MVNRRDNYGRCPHSDRARHLAGRARAEMTGRGNQRTKASGHGRLSVGSSLRLVCRFPAPPLFPLFADASHSPLRHSDRNPPGRGRDQREQHCAGHRSAKPSLRAREHLLGSPSRRAFPRLISRFALRSTLTPTASPCFASRNCAREFERWSRGARSAAAAAGQGKSKRKRIACSQARTLRQHFEEFFDSLVRQNPRSVCEQLCRPFKRWLVDDSFWDKESPAEAE